MRSCPKCLGTGFVIDQSEIGAKMKDKRLTAKMTLKQVGARMECSFSYVCDLEHGRRSWSETITAKYLSAVSDA